MSTKKTSRKPRGYWDDFANVERELREFIARYGIGDIMPTQKELADKRRTDLAKAIDKHGGIPSVASRLKLTRPNASKPIGYWDVWENVKQEIRGFITKFGTPGVMPTYSQLVDKGRNDLAIAIMRRHKGFSAVAEKLALKVISKRTNNYWDNWEKLNKNCLASLRNMAKAG